MAGPFPVIAYALCSTPRTGSNYLCELLADAKLGHPDEYLNSSYPKWGLETFPNGYELVRAKTRYDIFGIKIHWEHRETNYIVSDLDELHENMRWIFLRRKDIEAQARSWLSSVERDEWNGSSLPYTDASEERVQLFVNRARRHNAAWAAWFRQRSIKPLRLYMESVVSHPESTVEKIRKFVLE